MKTFLICLLISMILIVPSNSKSCRSEPDRCKEGECCVELGMFGRCKPLLEKGKKCELKQQTSYNDKHVYLVMCPCEDGLTCEEDNSGSSVLGQCI